jgi:hypothetical protein
MSSVMTVGLPRRCRSSRGGDGAPPPVITCPEILAFSEQEKLDSLSGAPSPTVALLTSAAVLATPTRRRAPLR